MIDLKWLSWPIKLSIFYGTKFSDFWQFSRILTVKKKWRNFFLQVLYWGRYYFKTYLSRSWNEPQMFFSPLWHCCIAIFAKRNETISDLWRKNIHISYILGRHSFEIFFFFLHMYQKPKFMHLKKVLTIFYAIWIHIHK